MSRYRRNKEITFQLNCSNCNLLIGFMTTKYFGEPKILCRTCYAKSLMEIPNNGIIH